MPGQALLALALALASLVASGLPVGAEIHQGPEAAAAEATGITIPSLDGRGNNVARPRQGQAARPYARMAPRAYADGSGAMVGGPAPRYVSNRIFADGGLNLFSEQDTTQWAWVWGQFLDHAMGLAQGGTEAANLDFDASDPLEQFTNDLGSIGFRRDAASPGGAVREQVNTVSSYLDAWNVYGGTSERLEWLREGPVDANLANNGPHLLLDADGFLPRRSERGNAATAPTMDLQGRLRATPANATVAGDVRANENIALTTVHTLFAREHNRIVDLLPATLGDQRRFDLARRVVIAEQQYITYREFLPAMGVNLPAYRGYDPSVNARIANEFATVGFRAHSMVHGGISGAVGVDDLSPEEKAALAAQGIAISSPEFGRIQVTIPLHVGFANPDLVEVLGIDMILDGLAHLRTYANDTEIDDQLRSVLFQVPGPGVTDPSQCQDDDDLTLCFTGVVDLGAIDIARGRDHGIPRYNDLREAYGLPRITSFTQLTGEATDQFPVDPAIDPDNPLDDPNILDVISVEPPGDAQRVVRRTTVAARLRAIYGTVDQVDAFVGMQAEPHLATSDLGQLQAAMWRKQFRALRDGDRFFHANPGDRSLHVIRQRYGIDHRVTLSAVIERNTDVAPGTIPTDVFKLGG